MELIVKFIKGNYTNKDAVKNVIKYIYSGTKKMNEDERIYGTIGLINNSDIDKIIEEMMNTKDIYDLKDGVQCKHMLISFGKKPKLKRKRIKRIIVRMLKFYALNYQIFYGVHYNDEPGKENYHVHVLLNSVNMRNGKKIDISNKVRKKFKKQATRIWKYAILNEQ